MAVREIKTRLAIDGEQAFRSSMKDISTQMREQNAQMKLISATYADNKNGVEALAATQAVLAKQIEIQNEKIKATKEAHALMAQSYGQSSTQATEYAARVKEMRKLRCWAWKSN